MQPSVGQPSRLSNGRALWTGETPIPRKGVASQTLAPRGLHAAGDCEHLARDEAGAGAREKGDRADGVGQLFVSNPCQLVNMRILYACWPKSGHVCRILFSIGMERSLSISPLTASPQRNSKPWSASLRDDTTVAQLAGRAAGENARMAAMCCACMSILMI